jgi:hypothetical protein
VTLDDIPCKTCGEAFTPIKPPKGGRTPVHCVDCRRDPATRIRSEPVGQNERKLVQRRAETVSRARAVVAADERVVRRLAIALSIVSDPHRACQISGIVGVDPIEIAAQARERYAEIVDPTNLRALGAVARALVLEALITAQERILDIPPSQLSNLIRAGDAVMATARDADAGSQYAVINLSVIGPDGQPVSLT